jgi:hypothetical protein
MKTTIGELYENLRVDILRIKCEFARPDISDNGKVIERAAKVTGSGTQMRNTLGRNDHETTSHEVCRESIVTEDKRLHWHAITLDWAFPFKTDTGINDAEIGRTKTMKGADKRG